MICNANQGNFKGEVRISIKLFLVFLMLENKFSKCFFELDIRWLFFYKFFSPVNSKPWILLFQGPKLMFLIPLNIIVFPSGNDVIHSSKSWTHT